MKPIELLNIIKEFRKPDGNMWTESEVLVTNGKYLEELAELGFYEVSSYVRSEIGFLHPEARIMVVSNAHSQRARIVQLAEYPSPRGMDFYTKAAKCLNPEVKDIIREWNSVSEMKLSDKFKNTCGGGVVKGSIFNAEA